MLVADLKEHPKSDTTQVPTTAPPGDHNLSLTEAAKRLGVSVHLIRRWIARREIPFIKLGRRLLFATKDIEAFEATHRVEAHTKSRLVT